MSDWHQNLGKPPRDKSAEVAIIWANNRPALHTYKVSQLDWDLRGWDFDIGFYRRAKVAAHPLLNPDFGRE